MSKVHEPQPQWNQSWRRWMCSTCHWWIRYRPDLRAWRHSPYDGGPSWQTLRPMLKAARDRLVKAGRA